MIEKSIKKNYILYLIRSLSSLFFPVLSFAYVSRTLSVEGIGKVDFSRSIVSYFTLFATLGITTYGIREGAKVRDDKTALSTLACELLIINGIMTLIVYVFFFEALRVIPKFSEYRIFLFISGFSIGFTSLGIEWLYGALEEYGYIAARTILFQIISLFLLFLLVKNPDDYYQYCGILVFSTVGSNFFNFIHARKYLSLTRMQKFEIQKHIKPILIFFSTTLAGNIYLTLDTSMVGVLSTDYAVGLYSAANKMNRIGLSVINSLSVVLMPRLAYYINNGEIEKYKSLLKKCFECVCILAFPIACGMFVLSEDILLIFSGKSYLPAANCSRLMSLIIIFIPLSTIACNQILIPFGKEKYQLVSTVIGSVSNLVVNGLLIPAFSETGAAIGTVVSEFMVCAFLFIFAKQLFNYQYVLSNIWHYAIATAIMAFSLIPMRTLQEGILRGTVSTFIGAIIYILILFLLKDDFTFLIYHSLHKIFMKCTSNSRLFF